MSNQKPGCVPSAPRESGGHFSREAGATIKHLGERGARHADVLGHASSIHAFQGGAQRVASMSSAIHWRGHVVLSGVILLVDGDRVLAVESEGQAPVAIDPD